MATQLEIAIRARDEAKATFERLEQEIKSFGEAAQTASHDAEESFDAMEAAAHDLENALEEVDGKTAGLADHLYEVGEAGGNAESGFRGIADISGFAAEQLGLPLAPLQENAAAMADLGGGIESLLKGFPALITQIGSVLGPLAAKAAAWWAVAAGVIAANAPLIIVIATIALVAAGLVYFFTQTETGQKILQTFTDFITNTLIPGVKAIYEKGLQPVIEWVTANWPIIAALLAGPFAPVVLLATDAFGVRTALVNAFDFVLDFVRGHWPEIAVIISGPFAPLVLLATDAFGVRSALVGAFEAVLEAIRGVVSDIYALVKGLVETMFSYGKGIVMGLWQGIVAMKDWFVEQAKQIGGWIEDAIPDWIPHSPPPAAVAIGEGIPVGIAFGIEKKKFVLGAAMQELETIVATSASNINAMVGGLPGSVNTNPGTYGVPAPGSGGGTNGGGVDFSNKYGVIYKDGQAWFWDTVQKKYVPASSITGGDYMTGGYTGQPGSGVYSPSLPPVPGHDWAFDTKQGEWVLKPKASFASGISYVPKDMVAQLHKGEAVIPAGQNRGIQIILNILTPDAQSFRDALNRGLGEEIAAYFQRRAVY